MAGGPWTSTSVGVGRPGLFINFVATALAAITGGQRGVVAMIVRAAWGPQNAVQEVTKMSEVSNYYSEDESGSNNAYFAAKQAFLGGAQKLKLYRIQKSDAVAATYILQDTQGAPVNAITFTGKYRGTRANNFRLSTAVNAADSTKTDVKLKEIVGAVTTTLATWTTTTKARGVAGHMAEIRDMINNDTLNFWLTLTLTGVDTAGLPSTPATVTDVAMTGGSNGAAVVMADYNTAQDAIEGTEFNVFTVDTIDEDIAGLQADLKAWIDSMRDYGKMVTMVTGSKAAATVAEAKTAAAIFGAEYAVYLHPGAKAKNIAGTETTYRGAAMAAQVAGILSSLEPGGGLTYKTITGILDLETRLSNSQLVDLVGNGVLAVFVDGLLFRIDKGINTLVTLGTGQSASWKKIAVINTLDAIANSITASANANYVGKVPNDEIGQKALLDVVADYLGVLAGKRAIKTGFTVELDPAYSSTGDKVFLKIGLTPIDSMDYIYLTVNVG